jgi:hypothetical protein
LQQVISALTQIDPALAHAIMSARIPQPGEALPGALLFFLSAVRQGDLRNWLGNNALDALTRAGKIELINKLMQDMHQTGQSVHDNVIGEWRSYPVPIYENPYFSMMHIYVHGDRHRQGAKDSSAATKTAAGQIRFLIDVRMSRLGALQLDGFVRQKQLDMIVRSEYALPAGLDRELKQSYIGVLQSIDYAGTINFQVGRQQWVNIQSAASAKAVV